MKTKGTHTHTIPQNTLDWFDQQFPKSNFHGRFQLAYRKKGSRAIWPLFTGERDALRSFLAQMYLSPRVDYYLTANAISGVQRNAASLFSLHNLVIDIDAHGEESPDQEAMEELLWRLDRDLFQLGFPPKPTSIVHTGRGVQLWWSIQAMATKCLPWYQLILKAFTAAIQQVLNEYTTLASFSVDSSASCNPVGYFRLPGTWNTHTGTRTRVMDSCPTIYNTHTLAKPAQELLARLSQTEPAPLTLHRDPFAGQYSQEEIYLLKDFRVTAFFRLRQLIQLRLLRNRNPGEETRNNLSLIFYSTLRPILGHQAAWDKLLTFNAGFKQPMTQPELERTIVSAKEKGGYKYKNKTLIQFLAVTREEQALIGLYPPTKDHQTQVRMASHPARAACSRLVKEHRNALIHHHWEEGLSIRRIAQKMGLAWKTVANALSGQPTIPQQVAERAAKGQTTQQIAQALKRSIRTIQRVLAQIKTPAPVPV